MTPPCIVRVSAPRGVPTGGTCSGSVWVAMGAGRVAARTSSPSAAPSGEYPGNASTADSASAVVGKRSSGEAASMRRTTASTSGGMGTPVPSPSGGISQRATLPMISRSLRPSNSRRPDSSSQMVTPAAN